MGKPSFERLQQRIGIASVDKSTKRASVGIGYQVFDILHVDDGPLLHTPLIDRKHALSRALHPGDYAQATEFILTDGIDYFEAIRAMKLEGMVAKRLQSAYLPGKRSLAWKKTKVSRSTNFIIGGYTFGGGYRTPYFGALLLGLYDEQGCLQYVGDVGGGFTDAALKKIRPMLDELATNDSAFGDPPRIMRFSFWCRPSLACKVRFAELTERGRLRFPIFDSLRPSIDPSDCTLDALQGAPSELSGGSPPRTAIG